ncbi:hypothetical protein FA95DRAFT_1613427 [Auriscalpium vulgare]|uniref:Uncharacterized protein n=1 Tax=Auriscalpium vulgare TaxID=40419 RepID=A0ACB8R2Y4_9AGAM|nr:hypothetical protein FA95DRAFT_1613427 [Auriscalpium vulgare]
MQDGRASRTPGAQPITAEQLLREARDGQQTQLSSPKQAAVETTADQPVCEAKERQDAQITSEQSIREAQAQQEAELRALQQAAAEVYLLLCQPP